jgi:GTP-binding protein
MKPLMALVGRPNVGKSTLFNRLTQSRDAIVADFPGLTRDRHYGQGKQGSFEFIAVDTGGFEPDASGGIYKEMAKQTQQAVAEADVVIFVVDAREGLSAQDHDIADFLRKLSKPCVLTANKAEGMQAETGINEGHELGFGEPIGLSAEHGLGLADLYQALAPFLAEAPVAESEDDDAPPADEDSEIPEPPPGPLKLAIVGRPNAGKSTLINKLLGEQRLVTGPEAGITRDSIAIDWDWVDRDGNVQHVRLIDTAGLRKRAKVTDKLEKLSAADTKLAIDFAEVVVLLLDSTLGLEAQDLRIADKVLSEGRALIIALNKWDAAHDQSRLFQGVRRALDDGLSQVKGVPLLTCSGATGKGLDTLIEVAMTTRQRWSRRVPTSALNRWFETATDRNPPPAPGGVRIKLRYVTQVATRPPTFVVFGNRTEGLPASYARYLTNSLSTDLDFGGLPIRLTFRGGRNPYHKK